MTLRELALPDFYKPHNARMQSYRPDVAMLRAEANSSDVPDVRVSSLDQRRILLLLIDPQLDFCHPNGNLYVVGGEGAVKDCMRTAQFIYRNLPQLTRIAATMDTHYPFQIFFPEFWLLPRLEIPGTGTLVVSDGNRLVNRGMDGTEYGPLIPNPNVLQFIDGYDYAWLKHYAKHYVDELKREGKYSLLLWPHHALLGHDGHRLSNVIHEAMLYHGFMRNTSPWLIQKGDDWLTESYSVFRSEVEFAPNPESPSYDYRVGTNNTSLISQMMKDYDAIIIGGQASSHCVKASVEDIITHLCGDRGSLDKIYLLTDCMSPVAVPGADFTDVAEEALAGFEQAGMHLVKSTTPMDEWPDFPKAD